jgi:hypothetical protein
MKHHEYGMSNWTKLALCAGFRPSNEPASDLAKEGTERHARFADLLIHPDPDDVDTPEGWAANEVLALSDGGRGLHIEEQVTISASGELNGIFGTPDVYWFSEEGVLCVADFKSFSQGTTNHMPQLMGYAHAIKSGLGDTKNEDPINLYVLHGGVKKVDVVSTTFGECALFGAMLIKNVLADNPSLCTNEHCKYCAKCAECPCSSTALTEVASGGIMSMPPPKALATLDALSSIIDVMKSKLKQMVIDAGGYLEDDGIAYAVRTRSAKAECHDIASLWFALEDKFNGNQEEFLRLCSVSKTAITKALKERGVKTKEINEALSPHYISSGEGTSYVTRVK